MNTQQKNIDLSEQEKFDSLAEEWWNPDGELRTLHHINPIRLKYIDNAIGLSDKRLLDIGCGGGLLSEAMADRGAHVTGLDISKAAIKAANAHKDQFSRTDLEYFTSITEDFSIENKQVFDAIVCMELLEHAPDIASLLSACRNMLKSNGDIILATINRTARAYVEAILGAEYILRLLPKGTHNYAKFVKPCELNSWLRECNFIINDISGMTYIPGLSLCILTGNPSVNYLVHATLAD